MSKSLRDINLKDLVFVILYGGLISSLLGIVIGFIDNYLVSSIGWSFGLFMFFISSQYIGNTVRKQYDRPNIVYTVITGIFLVFQAVIIYGLPLTYTIYLNTGDITALFNVGYYFQVFLYMLISIFTSFSFNYILSILFIVVGVYVGVRRTY